MGRTVVFMQNKKSLLGYLFVILSATLYGLMPLGANLIYDEGVNPISLVLLRNLFAIPFLALLAKLGGASFKVPFRSVFKMATIGTLGACFTPLLLFISYRYISGGASTVLHHIYPAVVVLGGIIFFKKKCQAKQIICLAICMIGVLFMYNSNDSINFMGAFMALLSGVVYGAYILLLSAFKDKTVSPFLFNFFSSTAITVIMFIVCLASGQLSFPKTLTGWGMCVVFSLAISVGAIILFQKGTYLIGGVHTAIISNFEIVTSVVAGALFLSEKVTLNSIISMILIIVASVLIAVFDSNKQKQSE